MKKLKNKLVSRLTAICMIAGMIPTMSVFANSNAFCSFDFNPAAFTTVTYGGFFVDSWNETKAFQLGRSGYNTDTYAKQNFAETGTGKRYKVSYEFRPGEENYSYVDLFDSNNKSYVLGCYREGDFMTGRTSNERGAFLAKMEKNTWYKLEVILDMTGDITTAETTLKTIEGTEIAHRDATLVNAYNTGFALSDLYSLRVLNHNTANNNDGLTLDNFVIEKIPEPASVDASDITLTDADGNELTLANATAQTKSISIDFGTAMNEQTLTNTNIYLEDTDTHNKIAYVKDLSENVYTMNLSVNLEAEKTYNLVISDEVLTSEGGKNNEDIVFAFTVKANVFCSYDFNPKTFTTTYGAFYVDSWDGTKAVRFGDVAKSTPETYAKSTFAETGTGKRYKVSYEFRPGEENYSYVDLFDSNNKSYVLGCYREGDFMTGRTSNERGAFLAEMEKNTWYKLEVILDMTGDITTAETTLKTIEGTEIAHRDATLVNAYNTGFELSDLCSMRVVNYKTANNNDGITLDNFVIEKMPLVPNVSEANVKLIDKTGKEQTLTSANILTSKIEIDFGIDMNVATLNSNNIYLVDRLTSQRVPYVASVSGNKYIMSLTALLENEKTYDIVVTTNVKTLDGGANISNKTVSFTMADASITPDQNIILNENFNGSVTGWSAYNASIVTLSEGNSAYSVFLPGASVSEGYIKHNINSASEGKFKICYRVKPGNNKRTYVSLHGSDNKWYSIGWFGNDTFAVGRTSDDKLESNMKTDLDLSRWYKVESIINITDGWAQTTLFDDNGTELAKTEEVALNAYTTSYGLSDIQYIRAMSYLNNSSADYEETLYDDISVEEIFEDPTITADSIKIYDIKGIEVSNYQSVNPLIEKITVDLGTALNTETIINSNIKLVDSKGDTVATILGYENRVVTLIVAEKLNANQDYTIVVSGNVESINGTVLGNDVNVKFTTAGEKVSAKINKVLAGRIEIDSLDELTEGTQATIEVDYENSTGNSCNLHIIVSYYCGNKLVTADYIKKPVDANVSAETQVVTHEIQSLDGVDAVKIMVWDGFDTMRPLSTAKVLEK